MNQQIKRHKRTAANLENRYLTFDPGSSYIVNEDLDHRFTKAEVEQFEEMWKEGLSVWEIARVFNRDVDEITLLVIDRVRKRRIKQRPGGAFGDVDDN